LTHSGATHGGKIICLLDRPCDYRGNNNLDQCKYFADGLCVSDGVRQAIRIENGERSAK